MEIKNTIDISIYIKFFNNYLLINSGHWHLINDLNDNNDFLSMKYFYI